MLACCFGGVILCFSEVFSCEQKCWLVVLEALFYGFGCLVLWFWRHCPVELEACLVKKYRMFSCGFVGVFLWFWRWCPVVFEALSCEKYLKVLVALSCEKICCPVDVDMSQGHSPPPLLTSY